MYFDSPFISNGGPFLLEFLLCLAPYIERFVVLLLNFSLGSTHELVESELPLDECRVGHQEFKLLVIVILSVHPPRLLDHNNCVFQAFRASEHPLRQADLFL